MMKAVKLEKISYFPEDILVPSYKFFGSVITSSHWGYDSYSPASLCYNCCLLQTWPQIFMCSSGSHLFYQIKLYINPSSPRIKEIFSCQESTWKIYISQVRLVLKPSQLSTWPASLCKLLELAILLPLYQ